MEPLFLEETSFMDVVWWMIMFFFFVMFLWMFAAIFADLFRRHDLSGWAKAGWTVFMVLLPFLGILIYMITRPKPSEEEIAQMLSAQGYPTAAPAKSSADEIAKAHDLLKSGALTQEEFDAIKKKALA